MGFWQGLKNVFFGKRKEDKRNEPKHLKVVHKPAKPSKALVTARKLPKGQRGRGYVRRARRSWCPGSIIPAALRLTAPKAELEKHMYPWYKRQLLREALQKAFPPKPEPVMPAPERRAAIQKAFGPESQ